ncbi:preprotein translocase subunit SecG [bacterium]|nr:preprotein translocase subunit SecG [bacterium]
MYILLIVLLGITSLGLVLVVLIQSGRGAGLSGALGMGEGQAVFGSRASDVLTKATEIFAIAFMILCLAVTWQSKHSQDSIMAGIRTSSSSKSSGRAPLPTMEDTEKVSNVTNNNDDASAVTADDSLVENTNAVVEKAGN